MFVYSDWMQDAKESFHARTNFLNELQVDDERRFPRRCYFLYDLISFRTSCADNYVKNSTSHTLISKDKSRRYSLHIGRLRGLSLGRCGYRRRGACMVDLATLWAWAVSGVTEPRLRRMTSSSLSSPSNAEFRLCC